MQLRYVLVTEAAVPDSFKIGALKNFAKVHRITLVPESLFVELLCKSTDWFLHDWNICH